MFKTISKRMFRLNLRSFASNPDFTKNKFKVQKGPFNSLEEHHLDYFRRLLGENRLVVNLSDLEQYNLDWFRNLRGNSRLVVSPRTTEEVSNILRYCNENRLAVCPQGGNTSVSGGAVPVFDEIVISTRLMNKIESIDETSGTLVCQAGCILENLENELFQRNLCMPLDLGAKGSCHIGGNVSTNAGGLRLLRYGNLHGNILGLEVVKANGDILDCLNTLKKDNTGYHLKHLFIGSEGTLGFVTKVAIQCPTKCNSINVALLGLQSYSKVLTTYKQAKQDLGEIISAVEVIDAATVKFVRNESGMEPQIGDYPFYLLIETSGSNVKHDEEKLHSFLEVVLKKHHILNGTVATEPSKVKEIWHYRESIAQTFRGGTFVFLYDFTLPLNSYFTVVEDVRRHMGDKAEAVFGFGHLGDGNLHLQVAVKEYSEEIKKYIEDYVYGRVSELKGSISSEHGIGFVKTGELQKYKSPSYLSCMREIKQLMDPNGILNPYKVLA